MKNSVFLSLLFLINLSTFCYGHNSNRILNGVIVPLEKYQNIVEIITFRPNGLKSHCTGTIISSRHVLTAAHCVTNYGGENGTVLLSGQILFYAERPKITWPTDYHTSGIYTKYDENNSTIDDIAIIEFNEDLPYTPVLLAKNYQEGEKDIGTNFGFGGIGPIAKVLIRVNMFISKECDASNEKHPFICAGDSIYRYDQGDSGGPLFITIEKQMYQIGVLYDEGRENGTRVGKNPETNLFTRLSVYCNWIENTTKGEAKCHEIGKAEAPLEPLPIQPLPTTTPKTTSTTSTKMMPTPTETTTQKPDNNEDGNGAMSKNIFVILLIICVVKIFY